MSVALVAMPMLGAIAWATQLFGAGDAASAAISSFFLLALLVPATVLAGNCLGMLAGGLTDKRAPSWLAVAFIALFGELAASGVPLAMADRGPALSATAYGVAHDELLWAVLGFGVATLVHRAWPVLVGHAYRDGLARLGCVVAVAGVQLAVAPQLLGGLRGMPRSFDYPSDYRAFAIVAGLGWMVAAAGATVIGFNLLAALKLSLGRRTAHTTPHL